MGETKNPATLYPSYIIIWALLTLWYFFDQLLIDRFHNSTKQQKNLGKNCCKIPSTKYCLVSTYALKLYTFLSKSFVFGYLDAILPKWASFNYCTAGGRKNRGKNYYQENTNYSCNAFDLYRGQSASPLAWDRVGSAIT